MKVKLSWFTFFPALVIIAIINIAKIVGNVQMFGSFSASYLSVFVVIISFAVNFLFSFLDKKTSDIYLINRNIPAAVFSLLSAGGIASKSFLSVLQSMLLSEYDVLTLITSGVGLVAAISFVAISIAHLQGKNYAPKMGAFFISIPIWICLLLIRKFMDARVISATDLNPIPIFLCIFSVILFLNLPMIIAIIEGKNPVKKIFVYGFPFIILGILNGFNTIYSMVTIGFDYSENILGITFVLLSLYVLFILIEMTFNANTVDDYEFVFDADELEGKEDYYGLSKDDFAISELSEEEREADYDYSVKEQEIDDFITGKSELLTNESGFRPEIDDVIVSADNSKEESDVIFVSRDKADIFEQNIASTAYNKSKIEENKVNVEMPNSVNDEANTISENDNAVKLENLEIPANVKQQFEDEENEAIKKIDKLIVEIGSIDDVQ